MKYSSKAPPPSMKKACPESSVRHTKVSPVKTAKGITPVCGRTQNCTAVLSLNNISTVHKKERDSLSGTLEDSGYLSLQNSRIDEHQDEAVITAAPDSQGSSASSSQSDNTNKLPILKFVREATEELTKGFRENKSYDWSIITAVAKRHPLCQVIGRHIGLECLDLFSSLLSKNMVVILVKILAMLEDIDLISCSKVSKTWRSIIYLESEIRNRYERAEQASESGSSLGIQDCSLTRSVSGDRTVLSALQVSVSTKVQSSSLRNSDKADKMVTRQTTDSGRSANQPTRFSEYMKVARSLKQEECLRPCMRCGSPAKCVANRAKCTRPSCQFDFCIRCLVAFHDKAPCRVVLPRSRSTYLLGSARSRRNIMRL